MTNQRINTILKGLQTAMRAEHEGYHFYMFAAENITDTKGQKAFRRLANDEFEHLNYLQAQFDNIQKFQEPNTALKLKKIEPFVGENPIFSEEIKTRIKDAHYEMTVLSVGIQLELNAVNAYKKLATETDDKAVAQFYLELAQWENSHYNMLIAQQDSQKEEYWAANHFYPF